MHRKSAHPSVVVGVIALATTTWAAGGLDASADARADRYAMTPGEGDALFINPPSTPGSGGFLGHQGTSSLHLKMEVDVDGTHPAIGLTGSFIFDPDQPLDPVQ